MPSWGVEGMPRWSAAPPDKNPERVVLADVMQDGVYKVQLAYVEDCSSLPTALAAMLLGIGTDELIRYLSDGMISVGQERVAMVIESTCVQRRSTSGSLTVKITNKPMMQIPIRMGAKGEFREVLKLRSTNGRFTVVP